MQDLADRGTEHGGRHSPTGKLAELLACERELAELLVQSREEAARRLERARAGAAASATELEAALEQEAERERARIREDVRSRVRTALADAHERAALYDDVSDDRVERLADFAFRYLLSAEEGA